MKIEALFLLGLLSVSNIAFAEGGCPVGTYPANPPATNICNPFPGNENDGQPQQPQGRWETRWGAIATDGLSAAVGAVTSVKSKRQAVKAAMSQCRAKGGKNCKAILSYYNQCAVIVSGDKQHTAQSAATINVASEIGMSKCSPIDTNCRIYYAECSPPVWIQ